MNVNQLSLKRLGIDTHKEFLVYMRASCHICISEGFEALTRLNVTANGTTIIATLNVLHSDLISRNEASLSESAWEYLKVKEGDKVTFSHLQPANSMSYVRAKIHGQPLDGNAFNQIIKDITATNYSNIELAAFITACAGDNLNVDEIIGLTRAMVAVGKKLTWEKEIIVDKHCVGGLPGNRTTPIIVSIIAAAGLTIPKTSSRAITSPAGTADAMETITKVNLSLEEISQVVKKENGCIAWGGGVSLSPADDVIIKVERALDIDSDGQMIASVLSKKIAAGSSHVVIDIPVGKTAKIRTEAAAQKLKYYFTVVGNAIGLNVKVLITDGSQPIGKGIGPALEALDVLAVLQNKKEAPKDLRERAIVIAGAILELAKISVKGKGKEYASQILKSNNAFTKFKSICEAQGYFKKPILGTLTYDVIAKESGIVSEIDNRTLAKVAKLSGAPQNTGAGILFQAPLGKKVKKGDVLFSIYSESNGELAYAIDFLNSQTDIICLEPNAVKTSSI